MDAVTYPDIAVERFLHENFVCVRLNQATATADIVKIMRPARLQWTPTLVFLDHHQIEVRRFVGFLPPVEFLAELHLVVGMVDLLHGHYARALEGLQCLAERYAQAHVAAEAVFWAGVAAFRHERRNKDTLHRHWTQLHQRYPDSVWWTRADVFGDTPAHG